MTILHYIPSIDRTSGGVGAYMQLLTVELGKLVELHIVTHQEDNPLELENCTVHYIPKNNNPFSAKGKKDFIRMLNEIHPDVFHTNCCWLPMSARTAIWAKRLGYKVVYTPHGMLEPWIMQRHYWTKKLPAILLFQKKGLEIADIVHSTADSEKQNLMQLGWNDNVTVIPNCVQVEKIAVKESWKRNKEILFLSRVHVKKGINFLIEAVAAVNEEYRMKSEECPISRCIIAGEGDEAYIDELKEQARRLGVNHIIDFAGGVYGERKWDLLRNADLFVLPTHSENFGIVVAEALACGTPVITTKGTPWQELEGMKGEERRVKNPDALPQGMCGWWTEIGTEATFKALKEFLQCSETELEVMGRNGRRLVEEKYSTVAVARLFVDMYDKLIRKTTRSS